MSFSTDWAVKPSTGYRPLDNALESPSEAFSHDVTPTDQFFVCNTGKTPHLDPSSHRIRVTGDGISTPLKLSLSDLTALPQHSLPACLECAGNHRKLFHQIQGQELDKRPGMAKVLWGLGGVGMAEWRGPRLRDVLEAAGILPDATHVCSIGTDFGAAEGPQGGPVRIPMPVAKALDEDTIIALTMNGSPLSADHGYPARMIVPGWVGTYSVKWLGEITVSKQPMWVHRNTEMYVLYGKHWDTASYAPAKGAPITEIPLKSSLSLPWSAELTDGWHRLHGFARSAGKAIKQVEWRVDNGDWQKAKLRPQRSKYAWVRFEFDFHATPGSYSLFTRATDINGDTQPDQVTLNDGGFLFNAVHPHPVNVI